MGVGSGPELSDPWDNVFARQMWCIMLTNAASFSRAVFPTMKSRWHHMGTLSRNVFFNFHVQCAPLDIL